MILFLVFGKSGNPQIACGAANLQRGVKCNHNLQNADITKFQDGFPNKKSLNPHSICVFKHLNISATGNDSCIPDSMK